MEELKNLVGEDVILVTTKSDPGRLREVVNDMKEFRKLSSSHLEIIVPNTPKRIPEIVKKASELRVEVTEISYRRPTLK